MGAGERLLWPENELVALGPPSLSSGARWVCSGAGVRDHSG